MQQVQPKCIVTRRSTDILAIKNLQVARALRYILDQYANPVLCVNEVVAATDLSRRELEKAFRKGLARSINREIIRARIERVKETLAKTNTPAVKVSAATSFSRTNHFFRSFRQMVEMSPKVYRARRARTGKQDNAKFRRRRKLLPQAR